MSTLGLATEVVDDDALEHTANRFREAGVLLPTFRELAEPRRISPEIQARLATIDPGGPDPLNLFRVHFPGLRYAYARALLVVTSLARAVPHYLAGLLVPKQRARGRSYLAITRFALSPKW